MEREEDNGLAAQSTIAETMQKIVGKIEEAKNQCGGQKKDKVGRYRTTLTEGER